MKRIAILLMVFLFISSVIMAQKTKLYYEALPQVDFGVKQIEKSFKKGELQKFDLKEFNNKIEGNKIVLVQLKDAKIIEHLKGAESTKLTNLESEGFSLIIVQGNEGRTYYVAGFDGPGLMYGAFELAEQIRLKGINGVTETKQNPYMKDRGVKFNIPLDVRTPSYTDASEAAQKNIATVWDFNFWKEFIDRLALDRFNLISLWNLNPFPSMVKVAGYPEASLNDVERSTGKWKEYYPTNGRNLSTPEILKHVEILKKMTIDQKIAFWRKVMAYGKERNVYFYVITWNVFVNGIEGKYGLTDNYENPVTVDYIRKSVTQMILTYPDLKGIGLTTGENFINAKQPGRDSSKNNNFDGKLLKATAKEKEDWVFNTYCLGI